MDKRKWRAVILLLILAGIILSWWIPRVIGDQETPQTGEEQYAGAEEETASPQQTQSESAEGEGTPRDQTEKPSAAKIVAPFFLAAVAFLTWASISDGKKKK